MQFKLHNSLKYTVANLIHQAVTELYTTDLKLTDIYSSLGPTPNQKSGDLAFGCFLLAKSLKLAPPKIAAEIQSKLQENKLIEKTMVAGPYLNFFIHPGNLLEDLFEKIQNESFFKGELIESAPKTIIEFSQPNTHKEMHVGHMRNLCLGDALIKIHRYCGVETLSTTFPGDVGTHVAKCLWYYTHHTDQKIPSEENRGAWLGTLYTKGNNLLEEQKGTDLEEKNRAELTEILKQIEKKEGHYYDLWKETREWSIALMESVYAWANVKFDSWYWESDVDSSSVKLINEYYEKGLFVKDKGAIGIDLSDDKLGFCLLLKSDGTGLYATKDVELARRKFEDQKVEKSIYVVDNRQALHFKQVFKVLEKMGFEHAKDCYHLQYEMVELPDGAMSSRKGNVVPLQELIDQMQRTITTNYLDKYKGDWSDEEIKHTAHIIAAGAIKFGMNKIDPNKKIVFDMHEWLKLDGESGPYIQYVYARIQSLLNKLNLSVKNNGEHRNKRPDYQLLKEDCERELILKLSQFNDNVENALKQYKTSLICNYLYELAKSFNHFYAKCSVANAETEALSSARRDLCEAVAITIKHGLLLLGVEAPEKM